MHVFFVSGIFQLEVGICLAKLPLGQSDWADQIAHIIWPKRLARGATGKNVVDKWSDWEFKRSASEALSVYPALSCYISELDLHGRWGHRSVDAVEAHQARNSFLQLCNVLDCLQKAAVGDMQPDVLQANVTKHLGMFKQVHDADRCIPKHHMAQHLPGMLPRFGSLLSCFVHERKHNEVKRIGNQLQIHGEWMEQVVLRDVGVAHHLKDMEQYTLAASTSGELRDAPDALKLGFATFHRMPARLQGRCLCGAR